MIYKTLRVPKLPRMYKNGEICPMVHFHIDNIENFTQNDPFKEEYIEFVYDEINKLLENKLVLYQPETVGRKNHRLIIIYKDNCELVQIKEKATLYLQELNYFTSNKMDCYFGVAEVMMLEGDKEPGMFKIKKKGEDFLESDEYKNDVIRNDEIINLKELSSITPLSEFRALKESETNKD